MSADQAVVPIRLLVDHSKDAYSCAGLVPLEPDGSYATTRTWEPVTGDLLRNYDALACCGATWLPYSPEELDAIEAFVRGGGGLLLAANAAAFEARALRPTADLSANRLAERFGVRFLSPSEARGRTTVSDLLVRGYQREAVTLRPHAAVGSLGEQEFALTPAAPLALPEGAKVFLQHRETGEPLGAALSVGEGRVLVMADTGFADTAHPLCRAFVDWLAEGRFSAGGEAQAVPDTIGGFGSSKRVGEVGCFCEPGLEGEASRIAELRARVTEYLKPFAPEQWKPPTVVELMRSCTGPGLLWAWWWYSDSVATQAADAVTASLLVGRSWTQLAWESGLGRALLSVFGGAAPSYMMVRALEAFGAGERAAELREAILAEAEEAPPGYDLTRAYEYHPKGFWALHHLHHQYGDDLLARLVKALPEGDKWEGLPTPFATQADGVIYYLSLAAGEDLFPWFASIGCAVHPLPLVRKGEDGFAAAMRACAEQGLRNASLPTSDRMDAVEALAALGRKDEDRPTVAERLAVEDPYARLVAAAELAASSDSRCPATLRELTTSGDEPLQAMAALTLARAGDRSAGECLLVLAPRQDARFALDAGYALAQLGLPGAEALQLEELTLADGTKPGGFETYWDGATLRLWLTVDGYKVANVFAEARVNHFPHNTHVKRLYVQYVHTDPRYRRKGLSRTTLAQTLVHPAAGRCSCLALGTGVRNVAHTMYRSFGFTDWELRAVHRHSLETEPPCPLPEGVTFRSYRPGDEQAIADLVMACDGAALMHGRPWAEAPRPALVVKVAERDGELAGVVGAELGGTEARLTELCVKAGDAQQAVAVALLSVLHAELRRQRTETVTRWGGPVTGYRAAALAAAGYLPHQSGGVGMWGLLDLPRFLGEIAPLLERRLADSSLKGWTGSLDLRGGKHRARLAFDDGRLAVAALDDSPASLALAADDDTMTRVVGGIETPFEAYLQTRLTIAPRVGEQIVSLLETLFPAVARR